MEAQKRGSQIRYYHSIAISSFTVVEFKPNRLDILDNSCVHSALKPVVLGLAIMTGSLSGVVSGCHLLLHGLVDCGQEDDLAIGGLSHGLHRLKVPDLHGRRGGKNIGRLVLLTLLIGLLLKKFLPDASIWQIPLQREQQ